MNHAQFDAYLPLQLNPKHALHKDNYSYAKYDFELRNLGIYANALEA